MKRSQNSSPTLCRCNGCTSRNPKGLLWIWDYVHIDGETQVPKFRYHNTKKIWRKINE